MNKFSDYHLEIEPMRTEVPGPRSREILALQKDVEASIVSYPVAMPMALKSAKGAIIEDVDGNRFIDFFAGCGVLNLGHSNPYILKYVIDQLGKLTHALDFPTTNKMDLIHKILSQFPKHLQSEYKVAFTAPTGSDAIEAAIKLAKHHTGRESIIVFHGSYHGMTSGALATTSNTRFRHRLHGLVPNIHFIPYGYCYRCPFKHDAKNCSMQCASYLDEILSNPHSGVTKPAAILLEPIQGEGGNIVPKDGYLEKITEIAHRHDVIVIFDEIQSGFFRSGKFLASQWSNADPDIITMSKGIGGIGLPLAALVYKKSIESWGPGDHIGTFRSNQASIAASIGAFDFVDDFEVDAHVIDMGKHLMRKLVDLAATSRFIGDVRGRGLMIGVEFVKDKSTKEPFGQIVKEIRHVCLQAGLVFEVGGHYNNVLRFVPPLIIDECIIDQAMLILGDALMKVEAHHYKELLSTPAEPIVV